MWLLVKLILLQKYYIYAVLAHNGGNKGINVLVISCAIGAKRAIERDWPQPTSHMWAKSADWIHIPWRHLIFMQSS